MNIVCLDVDCCKEVSTMHRVIIGAVFHETNTFWPFDTGLEEFRKRNYFLDDTVTEKFQGTRTVLGAFIEVMRNHGVEVIPTIAAIAEPSGPVTTEAIEQIKKDLFERYKQAGKVDGILLSLHGAMVTRSDDDGDGEFLESLRAVVGEEIPVIATLDLHTNLTERMVKNSTALIPYREYPHADMYARGLDAANLMIRVLNEGVKPVMKYARKPMFTVLMETGGEICRPIMELSEEIRQQPGIINASVLHGFYAADTADTCLSSLVISDGDEVLAQQMADRLADVAWEQRVKLGHLDTYTPQEAIAEAETMEGTVVFADICDNPGAGSSEDGTHLLRALLEAKVQNVAYAMICDAETVEECIKAGVGSTVNIRLGGKMDPNLLGAPIECTAYVKTISDGIYKNRGPMHGGLAVNLKKSVVIVVDGISIVVGTVPTQVYDIEIFQSHGLSLKDFKILVVKSSVHYKAAFGPHCKKAFSVECPGGLVVDPKNLCYQKCMRPIYPLDEI